MYCKCQTTQEIVIKERKLPQRTTWFWNELSMEFCKHLIMVQFAKTVIFFSLCSSFSFGLIILSSSSQSLSVSCWKEDQEESLILYAFIHNQSDYFIKYFVLSLSSAWEPKGAHLAAHFQYLDDFFFFCCSYHIKLWNFYSQIINTFWLKAQNEKQQ